MFLLRARLLRRSAGGGFDGSGASGSSAPVVVVPSSSVVCHRRLRPPSSTPRRRDVHHDYDRDYDETITTMRALVAPRRSRRTDLVPHRRGGGASFALDDHRTSPPPPAVRTVVDFPSCRCRSFSTSGRARRGEEKKKEGEEEREGEAGENVGVGVEENFFLSPSDDDDQQDAVTGKWTDATRPELSREERRLLELDHETREEEVMARLGRRWTEAAAAAASAIDGHGVRPTTGSARPTPSTQRRESGVGEEVSRSSRSGVKLAPPPTPSLPSGGGGVMEGEGRGGKGGEYDARGGRVSRPRRVACAPQGARREGNSGCPRGLRPAGDRRNGDDDGPIPHNVLSSGSGGGGGENGADGRPFDADLDLQRTSDAEAPLRTPPAGGDPLGTYCLGPESRSQGQSSATPSRAREVAPSQQPWIVASVHDAGGKIMNRVQSRLGAKDQRKIARLVKRARHTRPDPASDSGSSRTTADVHEDRGEGGDAKAARGTGRYYDMEKILEHIAGPKGGKKREELDGLLGGPGALVDG
ncbi:hypothetical protein ACHAW5_003017 [Stephanodiscus triporus]|uniref:Uncharacterized protein n=1 Tax=Stephanodiscus triporus TaxID=2934178 RepID=A0ABD3NVM9_9STRA